MFSPAISDAVQNLPANTWNSTLGGLLMFAFGVWYLMFETKILNRVSSERETIAADRISKVLLTLQVRHSAENLTR